jgi:hypothetical protein
MHSKYNDHIILTILEIEDACVLPVNLGVPMYTLYS